MSLLDNECQNHIFHIATLIHKCYSRPFHRLNRQDGVNQENLDYSYEGIKFFLFQLLYWSFFKDNIIHKIHFYNYNGENVARLPPKFLVQQEAKFTLQHSGKNVFFIAFLFYIQIMYTNILEGLILNRTNT